MSQTHPPRNWMDDATDTECTGIRLGGGLMSKPDERVSEDSTTTAEADPAMGAYPAPEKTQEEQFSPLSTSWPPSTTSSIGELLSQLLLDRLQIEDRLRARHLPRTRGDKPTNV